MDRVIRIPPETFSCPVCFLTPTAQVYQCKNGHMICHLCLSKLRDCPQCREPFGTPPIRNRVVENALDYVEMPCAHEDCGRLLMRKELNAHEKICAQRPVSICPVFGYTCGHRASTGAAILAHLFNDHKETTFFRNAVSSFIKLPNILTSKEAQTWTQVLRGETQSLTPVVGITTRLTFNPAGDGTLTSFVLYFNKANKKLEQDYVVNCQISNKQSLENYACTWTASLVHFKAAENQIPFISTPLNYLLNQLGINSNEPDLDLYLHFAVQRTAALQPGNSTNVVQPPIMMEAVPPRPKVGKKRRRTEAEFTEPRVLRSRIIPPSDVSGQDF